MGVGRHVRVRKRGKQFPLAIAEDAETVLKPGSPITQMAFVLAFAFALPAIGVMTQWFYAPEYFTAQDYSYVIGSHCENIIGRTTTVGLSAQTRKCVKVFISERSEEQLRDFVDIFAATMLFYVYTIHAAIGYLNSFYFKAIARVIFCVSVLTEAVFMFSILQVRARFDAEFENASLSPDLNLLDPAVNDPFRDLIDATIIQSTVVRALTVVGLAVFVVRGDTFTPPERLQALEARYTPADGLPDRLIRRLYVFCFTVLCCIMGFTVLLFYVPETLTAEEASYLVGGHCSGVEGFRSAAEVCASPTVSSPVHGKISCSHLEGCIQHTLAVATEDQVDAFYTVYVTIVLFYALTLVEALGFFRAEDDERHARWHQKARVLLAFAIFIEMAFLVTSYFVSTQLLQTATDLDNNRPLAPVMQYSIGGITSFRLVVIVIYFCMYVAADWEAQLDGTIGMNGSPVRLPASAGAAGKPAQPQGGKAGPPDPPTAGSARASQGGRNHDGRA